MFNFFQNHQLVAHVRRIMGWVSGGVFKRIDENRELLELLRDKAPNFVSKHPWVVGWLQAQDDFLCELADAVPLTEGRCLPMALNPSSGFPRPWPGETAQSQGEVKGGGKSSFDSIKVLGVDRREFDADNYRAVLGTSLRRDPELLVIANSRASDEDFAFVKSAFLSGHQVMLVNSRAMAPSSTEWLQTPTL